ncbi:hypothetical protein [Methyloversatilis thermotolerans]|uniref:hypothetical protein n=1 Tax=Methyloversatilis thermotolerans TaxID=1346290 RepID=UPI00037492F6|nr:hypothetical protein [Methyloversatilis thermotolerans]
MTGRILTTTLAVALAAVALFAAYQTGRIDSGADATHVALSPLDGREVFDEDGATLGVVEQTVAARHGERGARYAMVRVSRGQDAGLRLAIPEYRLQPVEDGLMLSVDVDEEGDFQPTMAQLRNRT